MSDEKAGSRRLYSGVALDYGNNVNTGDMCNIWGETVGTGATARQL